jgi:hypothetical protein
MFLQINGTCLPSKVLFNGHVQHTMTQQMEKTPAFYEDNKQQSQLFILENTLNSLNRPQNLLLNATCLYTFCLLKIVLPCML